MKKIICDNVNNAHLVKEMMQEMKINCEVEVKGTSIEFSPADIHAAFLAGSIVEFLHKRNNESFGSASLANAN